MLLSEIPGYEYPTVALFAFRWYETGSWIIRALKALPSGEVKWMYHCIEHNGHAKAQAFATYEEGRAFAAHFNDEIASKVHTLELAEAQRVSLILKATKEVTVQARLADEEHMMLEEAQRRHAATARPAREKLILPPGSEALRESLFEQLKQMPYLELFFSPIFNTALARTGEFDWSRRLSPTKKCAMCCAREKIARGFGFSGTDHWGKTKAEIRAKLLPRANQLLQLASVQKILLEAKARGQRVVVMGGFVFWYEESGTPGWMIKTTASASSGENGDTLWHEGTIISKNHGRIVVLPYIKASGQKVQGHTKNSSHDQKALPRHPDEYVELPFEVLRGDLMIGLFGELPYE
ncbi:hypothetical protein [Pseudomonas fulva]|uniref:hypothetical protein n=1 Tax=Pseudomonas fulva TaxID=47880 RepID=UPI001E51577C|nr:hypothetical protein [Pseudomonas fulva]